MTVQFFAFHSGPPPVQKVGPAKASRAVQALGSLFLLRNDVDRVDLGVFCIGHTCSTPRELDSIEELMA
jgi:hypothetical protein